MKRLYVIILILSFFIFYNNSGLSAEEDVKTKIEARLQELKRQVLQEQVMLRALNEKLMQENEELRTRHRLPEETAVPPKERVVYQASPEQRKQIQELEKKIAELNKSLSAKEEETGSLHKQLVDLSDQRQGLEQKVNVLNKLLEDKEKESAQKEQEIPNLKQITDNAIKRVQELEQKLSEIDKSVQAKQQKELSSTQGMRQTNKNLSVENTQLKLALQEARQENTKLSQEAEALRSQLGIRPKGKIVYTVDPGQQERIQDLEKNLVDLNNALQAKTQEINQKDEEISNLRQAVDYTYQRLDNILMETPR